MTKIFVDTSSIDEIDTIGQLGQNIDGVTTNPSNFVKTLKGDVTYGQAELLDLYEERITQIHEKYPNISISMEVYADNSTQTKEIIDQAHNIATRLPYVHIKVPIIPAGIEAIKTLSKEGVKLNLTLCFTQEQAYAVHLATKGAKRGDIYVSPFVGRLLDLGINGFDLIQNIRKMYDEIDSHVLVLGASIRNGEQLGNAIFSGSDIVTSYPEAIHEWIQKNKPQAEMETNQELSNIAYKLFESQNVSDIDISHPLTQKGLIKFAEDWNSLIK